MPEHVQGTHPPEISQGFLVRNMTGFVVDDLIRTEVEGEMIGVGSANSHAKNVSRAKCLDRPVINFLKPLPLMSDTHNVDLVGIPIMGPSIVRYLDVKIIDVELTAQREAIVLTSLVRDAQQVFILQLHGDPVSMRSERNNEDRYTDFNSA